MKGKYAKIVFGLPLEGPFDYLVPVFLRKEIEVGKRVLVPFRNEKRVGYCIGISERRESRYVKEIFSILDTEPLLNMRLLTFLKQIAEFYFSTWGEIIETALPSYLRNGRRIDMSSFNLKIKEETLKEDNEPISENLSYGTKDIIDAIEKSQPKNLLIFDDYFQTKRIEIFLKLSSFVLTRRKDVLIIVPELSKIEDIARVFKERFGEQVLFYHSGLSEKEKFCNWCLMREESPKITVGSRMAIYHPKESIGLVIVDDESSAMHKQNESPFYNTRDVALRRARFFKIPLILCGSPVSLDSYYKAEKKEFMLIDLRQTRRYFPAIHLVDLGKLARDSGYKMHHISKPLEFKIAQVLSKGKKIILFLNRRGFSTLIKCLKCGRIVGCSRCEQNLTYHFGIKKLVCHRCGFKTEVFSICPYCNSSYLRYRGMGTEKLESELSRLFPQAKISRLDLDVRRSKEGIASIIKDFREKRIDILIGTNLLVKELDLSGIGLLGIINLEQGINFPDFRGSERLFSLLLGLVKLLYPVRNNTPPLCGVDYHLEQFTRGSKYPAGISNGIYSDDRWGELLIQTFNPDSNIIKALRRFDYDLFYREEIASRRELRLPPFKNLIILNLRGRNKKSVENNARQFSQILREKNRNKNIFISEAIPHPLYKLRDKFRWQIFIKSRNFKVVYKILKSVLRGKRRFKGNILTVDIEPGGNF